MQLEMMTMNVRFAALAAFLLASAFPQLGARRAIDDAAFAV
jgi:hypothetical protein